MPKRARKLQTSGGFINACLLVLVLLLATLAGCDNDTRPQVLPYLFEQDVVVAFGDSLTYGTGARRDQSYPAVLSGLIKRNVVNAGVPGETTAEGLERLPGVIEEYDPALVLLCLGGNDFLRKRPASMTERNLDRMLSMLKSENIAVVLIGVPRPSLSLDADPVYEELAERYDVVLVENLMGEVLSDGDLRSDRIHPNARGYHIIAEKLSEVLDKHGAI